MLNAKFDLGDRVKLDEALDTCAFAGQVGVITGVVEFMVVTWPDGSEQVCHPDSIEKAE